MLATSARPLFLTGNDRVYALETAERLSRLAGLALLWVVATGIYNAVTQIGFLSALWETAYGRLLLLKLCGVLGMVGLGAINRFRGLPALRDWAQGSPNSRHTPSGGERFLRIATVESLLVVWVLGCTALLSGASPPRQGSPGAAHHAAAVEASTALGKIAAHKPAFLTTTFCDRQSARTGGQSLRCAILLRAKPSAAIVAARSGGLVHRTTGFSPSPFMPTRRSDAFGVSLRRGSACQRSYCVC
ncbi:MAG: copper resistance D family protein [Anaerolineales bacterium]